MKIRVIAPVTTKEFLPEEEEAFRVAARPETEISMVGLDRGPAMIESEYELALAVPDLLVKVKQAETKGMDAVIIYCAADPGLYAARELVSIPVVGLAETSFHLASILAHRFSVVTILERLVPVFDRLFKKYEVTEKVASVRVVNIPAMELRKDIARLINATTEASLQAVREDSAHAIVLGCGGMIEVVEPVEQALANRGFAVPVINSLLAALKLAESLVEMGLAPSKRTYPAPPPRGIIFP